MTRIGSNDCGKGCIECEGGCDSYCPEKVASTVETAHKSAKESNCPLCIGRAPEWDRRDEILKQSLKEHGLNAALPLTRPAIKHAMNVWAQEQIEHFKARN